MSVSSAACVNPPPAGILRTPSPRLRALQLDDGSAPNVTLENVFVLKSRDSGLVVGVKGGYYFAAKYKSDPRSDPSLAVAAALANGFYWAVGAFSCSAALSPVLHVIVLPTFLWQRRMCAKQFIDLIHSRGALCVQALTHERAPWTACWLCHCVPAAALGAAPDDCRRPCFESTFINLLDDSQSCQAALSLHAAWPLINGSIPRALVASFHDRVPCRLTSQDSLVAAACYRGVTSGTGPRPALCIWPDRSSADLEYQLIESTPSDRLVLLIHRI